MSNNSNNNKSSRNRNHHNQKSAGGWKPKRKRNSDNDLSRALSWALRHEAPKLGLAMSPDGYVPVDDLLNCGHNRFCNNGWTLEDVKRTVANNDKQRYRLCVKHIWRYRNQKNKNKKKYTYTFSSIPEEQNNTGLKVLCIRANQGHSIPNISCEDLLERIPSTELGKIKTIVHGTYRKAWEEFICVHGLSRMKRNHIHFAPGLPDDKDHVISGMRKTSEIYIYIDSQKCASDEVKFYRSDNGVILTSGIDTAGILPLKYLLKVVDAKTKYILLQTS
jgi:2'-phosphotransferase